MWMDDYIKFFFIITWLCIYDIFKGHWDKDNNLYSFYKIIITDWVNYI